MCVPLLICHPQLRQHGLARVPWESLVSLRVLGHGRGCARTHPAEASVGVCFQALDVAPCVLMIRGRLGFKRGPLRYFVVKR